MSTRTEACTLCGAPGDAPSLDPAQAAPRGITRVTFHGAATAPAGGPLLAAVCGECDTVPFYVLVNAALSGRAPEEVTL